MADNEHVKVLWQAENKLRRFAALPGAQRILASADTRLFYGLALVISIIVMVVWFPSVDVATQRHGMLIRDV
jgi:hypothetical protein